MNDSLPPRWREASETLTTLLNWLEETRRWVETTAAGAAPPAAEVMDIPPVSGATAATLAPESRPEEAIASPDLFTLLAVLTALRQEVKLQTRSARHDREQAAQALEQLSRTVAQLDTMRQAEASRTEAALQDAERATAEALMEVHDALSRATREAERLITSVATALRQWSVRLHQEQERMIAAQQGPVPAAPAVPLPAEPQGVFAWLRGRFGRAVQRVNLPTAALAADAGRPETAAVLHQCSSEAGHMADRLVGLAAGYRLSLERLERLLATYGIAPIACLGQPVDAELMEVVQVVVDPSQPPGVVCDEVRRGYRRHGQVYRFAQVVATRATLPATHGGRREEE